MNDEQKAKVAAAKMEAVKERIYGVECILDLMADQGTEESPALRTLARVLDDVYIELDELTADETEAE